MPAERATRSGRQIRQPPPKDWHIEDQHLAAKHVRAKTQTKETANSEHQVSESAEPRSTPREANADQEVYSNSADSSDLRRKANVEPDEPPHNPILEPAAADETKPTFPGVHFPEGVRICIGLDGVTPELSDDPLKEEAKPDVVQLPTSGLQVEVSVLAWDSYKPRFFAERRERRRAWRAAEEERAARAQERDSDENDAPSRPHEERVAQRDPIMVIDDDDGIRVKDEPVDDNEVAILPSVHVIDVDTSYPFAREDVKPVIARLHNPMAKIKKDRELDDISIHARLSSIGLDWYPTPDDVPKDHLFNRLHLTYLYGGGFVATFPQISEDKLKIHGISDFAFFSLEYNPHAPKHAGAPGLLMDARPATPETFVHRVFTLIQSGKWLHAGFYHCAPSQSLTREEYVMQSTLMKTRWATDIISRQWGTAVAASIYLRKRLGRDPTQKEENDLCLLADRSWAATLTVEDVIQAYSTGQEVMGIYTMKCIGYDVEFQKFLVSSYPQFLKEEAIRKREKEAAKEAKRARGGQPPGTRSKNQQRGARKGKAGASRRKPSKDIIDSDSESSENQAYDVDADSDREDDVEHNEAVPAVYKSQGTRSRPIAIS